jgi:inner membrane transporter RhtA
VLLGVVIAAMNSLFYLAISLAPLGVVVTLEFWGPLAVAIAGSRRPLDLVWVALAAAGIWILGGGRLVADSGLGVLVALAAGGAWAVFILWGGRVARDFPGGRGLAISTAVAAAIVLPVALVGGAASELSADPILLAQGAVVALFASVVPWTLELMALRRISGATYGIVVSLEPAVAALLGAVVLGQGLPAAEAAAVGLVVAASAGASATSSPPPPVPGEIEP